MTFNCDLDPESAKLSLNFAHPRTQVSILSKFNKNPWGGVKSKGDIWSIHAIKG